MTKQREGRLQRDIQKKLKVELGSQLFIFKIWGNEHMMAGLPDLIGCYKGRFFGLEVKLPESRTNVSERQQYVGALIRRAGGISTIVTSYIEALEALRKTP